MKWHYLILFLLCAANLRAMEKEKEESSEKDYDFLMRLANYANVRTHRLNIVVTMTTGVTNILNLTAQLNETATSLSKNNENTNIALFTSNKQELLEILKNKIKLKELFKAAEKQETAHKDLIKQFAEQLVSMKEEIENNLNSLNVSAEDDQAKTIPGMIYNPVIDV